MTERSAPSIAALAPDLLDEAAVSAVCLALTRIGCPIVPRTGDVDRASVTALPRWLAKVHTLAPGLAPDLACLPVPLLPPAKAAVQKARAAIDRAGEPRPALEFSLAWLDREAPEA